jgi:acetoin utilization deacetylase AcuC-like enzyme
MCAAAVSFGAQAIVVSLGVDAAADDPESPLKVTFDGYRATGALIRDVGVPIVAVHEGGYHLPTLGGLVVSTLRGLTGA